MLFVDDYSGIQMAYFLKHKKHALEATEKYLADVAGLNVSEVITGLHL